MRIADFICEYIENLGVTHVFMLSGGGMMHLQDALSRREKLKYVCHHHEQSAAYAAEAYARRRNGLGVCFATSGPGALNLVTGIAQAFTDSTPVLFITGQAKTGETKMANPGLDGIRQIGTFEVDIVSIVRPITKYATWLSGQRSVKATLDAAVSRALKERPGPVLIDIPIDIQGAPWTP